MKKKKVLLIGDSIRMGYDYYVAKALKDTCECYYPEENCRFVQYCLRTLPSWAESLNVDKSLDLLFFNVGAWDNLILFNDGYLTPPDMFAYFFDKLCKEIKILFPTTKVVFATSIPSVESRFKPDGYRKNSDVVIFNKMSVDIAKKYGFNICDLYSSTVGIPEEYYIDAAHPYTREGTKLLTNLVSKNICENLNLEFKPFEPDSDDDKKIEDKIKRVLGI